MRTVILLAASSKNNQRGVVETVADIRAARFQHGGGPRWSGALVHAIGRDGTYGGRLRHRILDKDPLLGLDVVLRGGKGMVLPFVRVPDDEPISYGYGSGKVLPADYYSRMDQGKGIPAGKWVFEIEIISTPRVTGSAGSGAGIVNGVDEEAQRHVVLLARLTEQGVIGAGDRVYTPWMEKIQGLSGTIWAGGDSWEGLREEPKYWYSGLVKRRVMVNGFEAINTPGLVENWEK